jgi:hypothetical protein
MSQSATTTLPGSATVRLAAVILHVETPSTSPPWDHDAARQQAEQVRQQQEEPRRWVFDSMVAKGEHTYEVTYFHVPEPDDEPDDD